MYWSFLFMVVPQRWPCRDGTCKRRQVFQISWNAIENAQSFHQSLGLQLNQAAPVERRKLGWRHRAKSPIAAHGYPFFGSHERRLRLRPVFGWCWRVAQQIALKRAINWLRLENYSKRAGKRWKRDKGDWAKRCRYDGKSRYRLAHQSLPSQRVHINKRAASLFVPPLRALIFTS